MSSHLRAILVSLKRSAHNIKRLDQTLAKAITASPIKTTHIWNCILRAYSKSPTPIKAIIIYNHFMVSNFIPPDSYTYPALLKACTRESSLAKGREAHAHLTKMGLHNDIYVQNALIHFYGSTSQVSDARLLFDTMPYRDITSWNTLLAACNSNPQLRVETFPLFRGMLCEGVQVDEVTLVILLTSCAHLRGTEYGKGVYAYSIKLGLACNLNLENALLAMHAKWQDMNFAQALFNTMRGRRDVVSYTILVNGYLGTGLVDLARDIFDQMVDKDVVLWNSMIHGNVKAKRPGEAIALFKRMEKEMVKPDETTVVGVLAACAGLSDLQFGRQVHGLIIQHNMRQDIFVKTALIDMYSKCGSLKAAMVTFYKMEYRDVYAWTTVIEGLANYGYAKEALRLFGQMEEQGIKPNDATFVSVLAACRTSGLVVEGCFAFNRMVRHYNIRPKIEHLGALIDLLSRAGLLDQAKEFINMMAPEERLIAYKSLLSACISYMKIDLGLKVANELIKLDAPGHAVYILLSNFYALAGEWTTVEEKRRVMKKVDIMKEPGISLI